MNSKQDAALEVTTPLVETVLREIAPLHPEPITPYQIFLNYRDGRGTRFTTFGMKLAKQVFETYTVRIPKDTTIKAKYLTALDRHMQWPYFLDRNRLILFNEMDAMEFTLFGGDLEGWCEGKDPGRGI
jgi:hypothetical protein